MRSYEIVTRTRSTLPLPPTRTTNILIKGIRARVQRDEKVILNHAVLMNNHNHDIVTPTHPATLSSYYGELLKKTTDTVKKLCNLRTLRLWEDRASVICLESLEDCINRIVYLYCNPAKAELADSIDEYSGFNTWRAFLTCKPELDAEVEIPARWFPIESVPTLPPSRTLTPKEDDRLAGQLCSSSEGIAYTLKVRPFAFLQNYEVRDPDKIEAIRQRIISMVRETEAKYRAEWNKEGRKPAGAAKLSAQPYLKPHTPKKRERKIFLICHNRKRRKKLLYLYRTLFESLREYYKRVKAGVGGEWPAGTYTPWSAPSEFFRFSSA